MNVNVNDLNRDVNVLIRVYVNVNVIRVYYSTSFFLIYFFYLNHDLLLYWLWFMISLFSLKMIYYAYLDVNDFIFMMGNAYLSDVNDFIFFINYHHPHLN